MESIAVCGSTFNMLNNCFLLLTILPIAFSTSNTKGKLAAATRASNNKEDQKIIQQNVYQKPNDEISKTHPINKDFNDYFYKSQMKSAHGCWFLAKTYYDRFLDRWVQKEIEIASSFQLDKQPNNFLWVELLRKYLRVRAKQTEGVTFGSIYKELDPDREAEEEAKLLSGEKSKEGVTSSSENTPSSSSPIVEKGNKSVPKDQSGEKPKPLTVKERMQQLKQTNENLKAPIANNPSDLWKSKVESIETKLQKPSESAKYEVSSFGWTWHPWHGLCKGAVTTRQSIIAKAIEEGITDPDAILEKIATEEKVTFENGQSKESLCIDTRSHSIKVLEILDRLADNGLDVTESLKKVYEELVAEAPKENPTLENDKNSKTADSTSSNASSATDLTDQQKSTQLDVKASSDQPAGSDKKASVNSAWDKITNKDGTSSWVRRKQENPSPNTVQPKTIVPEKYRATKGDDTYTLMSAKILNYEPNNCRDDTGKLPIEYYLVSLKNAAKHAKESLSTIYNECKAVYPESWQPGQLMVSLLKAPGSLSVAELMPNKAVGTVKSFEDGLEFLKQWLAGNLSKEIELAEEGTVLVAKQLSLRPAVHQLNLQVCYYCVRVSQLFF